MVESSIGYHIISAQKIISDEITEEAHYANETLEEFDLTKVTEYTALLVISGNYMDTMFHWHHAKAQQIVKAFDEADKVIAAICCSVPTVRQVLRGKRTAAYPTFDAMDLLNEAGAVLTGMSVEVDGRYITAEHQMATDLWARTIVELIQGREVTLKLDGAAKQHFRFWKDV